MLLWIYIKWLFISLKAASPMWKPAQPWVDWKFLSDRQLQTAEAGGTVVPTMQSYIFMMDWKLYLSKWKLIFVQNVNVFENCWSRGEPFKSQVVTMTRNLHQKVIEGHAQSGLLHLDFNLKASFMHTRHFSIFQTKFKQGNGKIYNPFSSSHHHQMVSKPTGWAVL